MPANKTLEVDMLGDTIKAIAFSFISVVSLGMISNANYENHKNTHLENDYLFECKCHHTSINLIGECANPECPYYYGTLDW